MKTTICLLLLIINIQYINAQNSKAQISINAFEKQLEVANKALEENFYKTAEGKVSYLERTLASIKTKDPSYDASGLEEKLTSLKERCAATKNEILTKRADDKEQYYINVEANNNMSDYILSTYLPKDKADELSKIDVTQLDMDKYRESIVEITNTSIERGGSDGYQDRVDRHRVKVGNSYPGEAEKAYESFLDEKRYFDFAVKFFPGEPVLEKVQKQFQSLFDELGDIDAIKKAAAQNGVNEIANRKMPASVMQDAKIEDLFKVAFSNESKDDNWERTLIKINLTNRDWVIVKNQLTGVILGRKRYAAIAFKDVKKGDCRLIQDFKIYQEYNGSGYNAVPKGSSMASSEILCENIK